MRLVFVWLLLIVTETVVAVCPLCTVALSAGIGLTQYFGIDDTISGIWIGGFTVSLVISLNHWLGKKKIVFPGSRALNVIICYALVLWPLGKNNLIGHALNKLWGIDKIVLGIIIGSFILIINELVYGKLKRRNGGHAYFPFQKVVSPIVSLSILSLLFYELTSY